MFKAVTFESYKPKPKKSTIEAVRLLAITHKMNLIHEVIKFGAVASIHRKRAGVIYSLSWVQSPKKQVPKLPKFCKLEKEKAIEETSIKAAVSTTRKK
ncbi:hypothetical protein NQ317_016569 [Molorchus minor]|uniref:Uncharacterized protein n=1 Tax=Molorchus minor TaxID=1323400 RepID=A0ABQ9IR70_9CUCU|nr:hypothetical protein NQ317_016569 [Molorchus minor]